MSNAKLFIDDLSVGDQHEAVVVENLTRTQIVQYAGASGDFNPIHVDHEFAAGSHFGRTVAHGMLVAASISEMMHAAFGGCWARAGRMKIRFRAPVFPGETVTAFGQVRSVRQTDAGLLTTCVVGVRKSNGEDAITGEATVMIPGES